MKNMAERTEVATQRKKFSKFSPGKLDPQFRRPSSSVLVALKDSKMWTALSFLQQMAHKITKSDTGGAWLRGKFFMSNSFFQVTQ